MSKKLTDRLKGARNKTVSAGKKVYGVAKWYGKLYKGVYDLMTKITLGTNTPYRNLMNTSMLSEIGSNPYLNIPQEEIPRIINDYFMGEQKREPSDAEKLVQLLRGIKPLIIATSIIFSLFLLSQNITGNAISNTTALTTNTLGGIFFLLGLTGGFLFLKRKNHP